MMCRLDISIVIVNYKVKYFLEQTIRSAKEAIGQLKGEIIVIDNNSQDDSCDYIKRIFPDVILIENKENKGFGVANNQGFDIAQGEYTLILNPDTIIGKDTIADCIALAKRHNNCGGIGVCMHDGNGRFLPESKRSFPTPWVSFCKIFGLSSLFPYSPRFAKYHLRYLPNDQVHPIDILSGAFTFVRTDTLREVNGFDEDFFMYGEDIDLSFRIAQSGRQNYYLPTPIIHYKGESTQKNSYKYVRVFYEAMTIFFKKHYPHFSRAYSVLITFAINLRSAMSMASRFVKKLMPAQKVGIPAYKRIIVVSKNNYDVIQNKINWEYSEISKIEQLDKLTTLPDDSTMVVIDNTSSSYDATVRFICSHYREGLDFATYLSEAGVIISPKMA